MALLVNEVDIVAFKVVQHQITSDCSIKVSTTSHDMVSHIVYYFRIIPYHVQGQQWSNRKRELCCPILPRIRVHLVSVTSPYKCRNSAEEHSAPSSCQAETLQQAVA